MKQPIGDTFRWTFGWILLACCTLANAQSMVLLPDQPKDVPWPTQAWPQAQLSDDVDKTLLTAALTDLFQTTGPSGLPDHRAWLVVHRGQIVVETYAEGFSPSSRFQSWSMAKSVTNALVGILVGQGRLQLDGPTSVPEWQSPQDPRRALTLNHLLHMNTGLANSDGTGGGQGFVSDMLFGPGRYNTATYAANAALTHEPGQHWAYSTATTNIIGGLISEELGGRQGVIEFAKEHLVQPIGATSLTLEFDRSGNFSAGAFAWATARDWARLGYLFLRNGRWENRQLLPADWVTYTRTPAPASNNGTYGAHIWLAATPAEGQFESIPAHTQAFFFSGNGGQMVVMFPHQDLVIVRLGESHNVSWGEINARIMQFANAFPVGPRA